MKSGKRIIEKGKTMDLGHCEICGQTVVLTAYDVCYRCRDQRMAEVNRVLNFIREHRGATVSDIAEATGVRAALVLKLMRKGSIELQTKQVTQRLR